jgi:hypothetical protein
MEAETAKLEAQLAAAKLEKVELERKAAAAALEQAKLDVQRADFERR